MLKEFRDFVMRGNVIDLAVGVIIGAAFGAIVNSLVADIITPLILAPALEKANVTNINEWAPGGILLGKFISSVISFVIITFCLFLIIKGMNAAMKKKKPEAPAAPPAPTKDQELLMEIRDLLRK
jgi:large conductance mechanosensitive channel